ncbi:MAG: PstS family phosphate ABC transporter substrate-binding protein [Desulfomonilaceae bacterium]|nr:PstS family phosphate ABC transporter substrate-binding protein [Desulfomonilaceae bacterium]
MRFCKPLYLITFFLMLMMTASLLYCSPAEAIKIIKLKGANVMVNMCDKIGQEFRKSHPDVSVVVQGGTTDQGFEAFCDRAADIVMASRKINDKEIQLTTICGMKPVESLVGWDSVVILVNPTNPVSELTLEQLGKLLSGEYATWTDVGGPDRPVVVVSTERHSGTALFLQSFVMNDGYLASEAVIKQRYHELLKEVQRRPDAIGYASLLDARRGEKAGMAKIVGIKKDVESPTVLPSEDTVKTGTYPLLRPLYFYWQGPAVRPDVNEFVEFVKSKSERRP